MSLAGFYDRVPAPITRNDESNGYFHFHEESVARSPLIRGKDLAFLAREGVLTEATMKPLTHGFMIDTYMLRSVYTKYASWAIYTAEFLSSLAEMVEGRRVVEVGAGRGLLQPLMRERGIDWLSTDRTPPQRLPGHPYVMKRGWQRALKPKWGAEVAFMSWWPYQDGDDCQIAARCVEMGIPLIVVGEGYWGCTGTKEFWSDDQPWKIHGMPDWFSDVPQWSGIHDYTYVVIPKKSEPKDFFPNW